MSNLSSSQIDRVLCKIKGLNNFALHGGNSDNAATREVTCELDLGLLESFDDCKFISQDMFRFALSHDDLHELKFDPLESPLAKTQFTIDNPLDAYDKILVDESLALFMRLSARDVQTAIKTELLLPQFSKLVATKQEERRKEQQDAADAARHERLKEQAARKAAKKAKKAKKAKNKKGATAEAVETAEVVETVEAAETADVVVTAAATETTAVAPEAANTEESKVETVAQTEAEAATESKAEGKSESEPERAAEEEKRDDGEVWMEEYMQQRAQTHRYAGRKINLRFIKGWNNDKSSALWTLHILHMQLGLVDDGLTDLLRDVIVYEWLDKKSVDERVALGLKREVAEQLDLDALYKDLRLSDIVILPDGKSVLWYSVDGAEAFFNDGVKGFGVDIDPPYMRDYAIGIKHVFAGKLDEHPTLKWYRTMLAHPRLKELVQDVHYCPCDNISPFTVEETSSQMNFINDGYLIFELGLNQDNNKTSRASIEVLVKERPEMSLESLVKQLERLKFEDLSDFDNLSSDIVNTIADPLVEMKNEQEQKRMQHDSEFKGYTFKDPIHRSPFTKTKLMRNYQPNIERIVISDEQISELKFILPSNLFAFKDAEDDLYQENNQSLGMVHADAVVVTLVQNGEGYDFSSIDLADCVQIPFGAHQNRDANVFNDNNLYLMLQDLGAPVPEGWDEEWKVEDAALQERRELAKAAQQEARENRQKELDAVRRKIFATRATLRKDRKKKKR